jgi:hypothetical protein
MWIDRATQPGRRRTTPSFVHQGSIRLADDIDPYGTAARRLSRVLSGDREREGAVPDALRAVASATSVSGFDVSDDCAESIRGALDGD